MDTCAAKLSVAIQQMQQEKESDLQAADEIVELQAKLATCEERSRILEARHCEMRNDHATEKKALTDQYEFQQEQYLNRAITAESELYKLRAESGIYQQRIQRLEQTHEEQKQQTTIAEQSLQKVRSEASLCLRNEEVAALRDELKKVNSVRDNERKAWQEREMELQAQLSQMSQAKAKAAADVAKAEQDHANLVDMLRARIADLESEVTSHAEALANWEHMRSRLKSLLEDTQLKHAAQLNLANSREIELVNMLDEIQDSIAAANNKNKQDLTQTHATKIAPASKREQGLFQMLHRVKDSIEVDQDVDVEGRSTNAGSSRSASISPLPKSWES
jgi:hypothetical protein